MSNVGREGHSFLPITRDDLVRLAAIARTNREQFFAAHPQISTQNNGAIHAAVHLHRVDRNLPIGTPAELWHEWQGQARSSLGEN